MSYGTSGGGDDLRCTISMTGVMIIGRHSHRTAIYPTAKKEQALSARSVGSFSRKVITIARFYPDRPRSNPR